nr:Rap1a/Tai family immunity protein [Cedecea colo]
MPSICLATDGNELYDWYQADKRISSGVGSRDGMDAAKSGAFLGFTLGVADRMIDSGELCIPNASNATNGQFIDTVRLYLVAHPEKRALSASVVVSDALSSAFQCKR